MQNPTSAVLKPGYAKIDGTCRQSRRDGYDYCWIDTCCINKESSAELSEAINSMFMWYKTAAVCYALLSDVDKAGRPATASSSIYRSVARSRWFTRGWTLQELLAPRKLIFVDRSWDIIGARSDPSLVDVLRDRTGIPRHVLEGTARPSHYRVAIRMSWAAGRVTTRIEDMAYCLLGLFDINMEVLYGEGRKAFRRLQRKIIEESDDPSIFAWSTPDNAVTGMLAESPNAFANTDVELGALLERLVPYNACAPSFQMTNRGLHLSTAVAPLAPHVFWCPELKPRSHCTPFLLTPFDIYLRQLPGERQFARIGRGLIASNGSETLSLWYSTLRNVGDMDLNNKEMFIRDDVDSAIHDICRVKWSSDLAVGNGLTPARRLSRKGGLVPWSVARSIDGVENVTEFPHPYSTFGFYLIIDHWRSKIKALYFSFFEESQPVCLAATEAGVSDPAFKRPELALEVSKAEGRTRPQFRPLKDGIWVLDRGGRQCGDMDGVELREWDILSDKGLQLGKVICRVLCGQSGERRYLVEYQIGSI